ncbi:glycosyltransferase 87 family protein [Streptomyces sp. Da 82-17]|uniref:glycosyltransferase 87 family protein n=1 Tax=Streptomyces sp. Da 82-17 TaxID=3377116 RepID=UPI0038D435E1
MYAVKSGVLVWFWRAAPWQAWVAVGGVLAGMVVRVGRAAGGGGMDNAIVVRAARVWLDGGSPYADPHFLYLPSAVLAAVPEVLVPAGVLRYLAPAVVVGALLVGWASALRLYGIPWRSRFAVLGLGGLALGFAPFGHLVQLGNWTVVSAAALPLALLLAHRGRWTGAGAVVGAAVAVKPLLVPVLLLFVLARRGRALAVTVLVPAVASVLAALAMPDPAGFFTRTLPFLLSGDDAFVRLYEASPAAVLPRLGVPQAVASAVGLAGAGGGVWCAWRRWRCGDGGPARLAEVAVLLMLSAFLVSRPSYDHYLLVVVPLLLAGVVVAGAPARSPWFWLALVPQVPGFVWPWLESGERRAFKDAVTLCLLAVTAAVRCARRASVTVDTADPRPAGESAVPVSRPAF